MRKRILTLACVWLLVFGSVLPSRAFSDGSPEAIATDALLVRPVCLVATILGSAVFLVSLPVAAISKSTDKAANALVKAPAKATFTRPLGNLSRLSTES
jgi:hypothetical protein